jgi:hypothetical protein
MARSSSLQRLQGSLPRPRVPPPSAFDPDKLDVACSGAADGIGNLGDGGISGSGEWGDRLATTDPGPARSSRRWRSHSADGSGGEGPERAAAAEATGLESRWTQATDPNSPRSPLTPFGPPPAWPLDRSGPPGGARVGGVHVHHGDHPGEGRRRVTISLSLSDDGDGYGGGVDGYGGGVDGYGGGVDGYGGGVDGYGGGVDGYGGGVDGYGGGVDGYGGGVDGYGGGVDGYGGGVDGYGGASWDLGVASLEDLGGSAKRTASAGVGHQARPSFWARIGAAFSPSGGVAQPQDERGPLPDLVAARATATRSASATTSEESEDDRLVRLRMSMSFDPDAQAAAQAAATAARAARLSGSRVGLSLEGSTIDEVFSRGEFLGDGEFLRDDGLVDATEADLVDADSRRPSDGEVIREGGGGGGEG